jgi:sugar-phosphate isomerase, RpiB/LacA/LacB family
MLHGNLNYMKIGICNDHAGVEYKNELVKYLTGKGYEIVNFGTDSTDSMDYTDVAHPLASAVESGEVDLGIAFCGTGNGMAMTLNHHRGIRAGLAWSEEIGRLVKQHNNANVLVMPARFIPFEEVIRITDAWLTGSFEGGRHQRRIDKIACR